MKGYGMMAVASGRGRQNTSKQSQSVIVEICNKYNKEEYYLYRKNNYLSMTRQGKHIPS